MDSSRNSGGQNNWIIGLPELIDPLLQLSITPGLGRLRFERLEPFELLAQIH
jgi:hypothetical protein